MIIYCYITGASQSSDIGPIADAGSDAILRAKETIVETISGWIRGAS